MARVTCGIFALLFAASALADDSASPAQLFTLRQEADALFDAGRMAEAVPLYEQLRAANPSDGGLRLRLARALFETGSPDALELATAALDEGFGNEPEVAYAIAQVMAQNGEAEDAIGWLERALGAGYEDQATIKYDPAFQSLIDDERFRTMAGIMPAGAITREEGWSQDLEMFLAEIRRLHAAPDRIARSAAIADAVKNLEARIGTLSDEQIAVALQGILVQLGDGHSNLLPIPTDTVPFEILPLAFYQFTDGLFVVAAADPHLVGKQVVALGDRSTDTLLDDLRPYVSRDNDQGLLSTGMLLMRYPALLRAMGYADATDRVRITLADGKQVEIAPKKFDPPSALSALPGVETVPLWLRRPDDNFWHQPLPELDALYAQFNRLRDKQDQTIADYVDVLKAALRDGGARNLILDLRHNGGGNNALTWPLVRLAVWHQEAAPDHRLFVITGRQTFSAAQNLINRLEQLTDAVFVGEPSSSRPNFTGETTSVELPYSGLWLSISSRYWQDSQPGDRRPFIPVDMPVRLSSSDYFAGHDPVMAALSELLSD
jgi:tetratricopeptide (TPR) repeat protein